ncbi:MAG: hypothetical protein U5J99_11520 [Parvularculaceae bacterium]|nr:hypothetical protein [Parvularculaceae bacterium]
MAAFRFFSWILVAAALALLGADAVSSMEAGEPVIRTSGEILALIGVNGPSVAENSPGGMAKVLQTLLNLPLWAVLGLIGVVMTLIFRPME